MDMAASELLELNSRFRSAHPLEVVRWASERFAHAAGRATEGGLLMTSSFGAESMCLIHMVQTVRPGTPIVLVNTSFLFPETLEFMEQMRRRYGLNVLEYHSRQDPFVYLSVRGETDPRVRKDVAACCAANKNEVFDRAMAELAVGGGWLRGVRASQSDQRKEMLSVQFSARYKCWAISPLLYWTDEQIHAYMAEHQLPYHPLWAEGYVSIGCSPETCTRPVRAGEDPRAGRWGGTVKKEGGIHLEP